MTGNPGQSVTKHRHILDVLKVPEGNVLLLRAYDRGVQKYACPVNATSKAVPHAILLQANWMAARLWVMPRTRSILQLRQREQVALR